MTCALLIPLIIFGICWIHAAAVNHTFLPDGGARLARIAAETNEKTETSS